MPGYFVGVDGGTESIRAGVFAHDGKLLASAAVPYITHFPQPGWAEQHPQDWWECLGKAVKAAVVQAEIQPEEVLGLCVDTTCCTVCALDANGDAVCPALLWMDMRSASEAATVASTGDVALRVNSGGSGPVSAEWMVPKSLWIKTQRPEVWAQAAHVCEYQDYINWKLTGNYVGSINNASVRWHYDIERGWPVSMLDKLGLSDLQPKWPQKLVALGEAVGRLTAGAAAHTGLPAGLLVAQGGADAFIGMIGLGVVQPGQMALLTGSSHLQLGMAAVPVSGKGIFGSYNSAVLPGIHVVEGGQTSTGSIVNWFKRTLCGPPGAVSYDELNAEADRVPPGCDGLVCLDHFQGNRTPHTDALSRGAFSGLTLAHTRGHMFRSMMEGVAMGTRLILDTMKSNGYSPDCIVIAGGATRSPLWLQIHADVAGVPFVLTEQPEAPMLGCAVLAAVAAGLYPDVPAAAAAMVKVAQTIHPRPEVHAMYAEPYDRYCKLYSAVAPLQPGRSKSSQQPTTAVSTSTRSSHRYEGVKGIVAPSILACDFARLADEVTAALSSGGQWVHVDMFDGSSLARGNWTLGPPVLASLHAAVPEAFLDCHIAADNPVPYLQHTAQAGASSITFHLEAPGLISSSLGHLRQRPADNSASNTSQRAERAQSAACTSVHSTCPSTSSSSSGRMEAARAVAHHIRGLGCRAGLALCPATPADEAIQLAKEGAIDMVLCMTVEPGWGGQRFMPEVLDKVKQIRAACPHINIQVDGGINSDTATQAAAAGANVLVAGSAIFNKPDTCVASNGNGRPSSRTYNTAVGGIQAALTSAGYVL